MQIFKKLLYNILAIQEKLLRAQLSKTIGVKNNSKKKRHYFGGCTIDLSTLAENEKQKLEEEMTLILKKYNYEPYEILKYIEKQGTKVFYLDNASKFLTPLGEKRDLSRCCPQNRYWKDKYPYPLRWSGEKDWFYNNRCCFPFQTWKPRFLPARQLPGQIR